MISITKTYMGFDEKEYTETAWFNMNKSEVIEMAMGLPDDATKAIGDASKMTVEEAAVKLIAAMGKDAVMKFMRGLVIKAYGVRSEDGKRFKKTPELTAEFAESALFDEIYSELLLDNAKAEEFISQIIPASLAAQLEQNNK